MNKHKDKTGYPKFVNREWLYDLLWYKEDNDGGYSPLDFPLIVESEWEKRRREDKKGDRHSGIKYDFQKLLLSNTGLRLMVFEISKEEDLNLLSIYFNNAIAKYTPLKKGKFLFIAFHNRKSLSTIGTKKKKQCPKKCVRFSFVLPLRLGVPQAGGEFVMLTFICRFT